MPRQNGILHNAGDVNAASVKQSNEPMETKKAHGRTPVGLGERDRFNPVAAVGLLNIGIRDPGSGPEHSSGLR